MHCFTSLNPLALVRESIPQIRISTRGSASYKTVFELCMAISLLDKQTHPTNHNLFVENWFGGKFFTFVVFFFSHNQVLPSPREIFTGSSEAEGVRSSSTQTSVQLRYRPPPPGVTDGSYRLCKRYDKLNFI